MVIRLVMQLSDDLHSSSPVVIHYLMKAPFPRIVRL
jgi:hypothetical protein